MQHAVITHAYACVSPGPARPGPCRYSESLGYEIPGVFEDSYSQFGQLSFEMMRACRLVVDTGMHAFNWSRDMAVEYMAKHTSIDVQAIKHEIDRYITWWVRLLMLVFRSCSCFGVVRASLCLLVGGPGRGH